VALELAEIFRRYGPAYRQKYANRMPATHLKAMRAVEQCRTEALGGQVYFCPQCEQVQYSYHSCRNRHCPKCQNKNAQRWLEKQQALLLPVPYFLLTFTVPAAFNEVARSHQRLFYTGTARQRMCDLLFKTSAAATQQLAHNPRWLGGQIGLVGILHTWGRNLA
jgi:Transposase zinc-binding domain